MKKIMYCVLTLMLLTSCTTVKQPTARVIEKPATKDVVYDYFNQSLDSFIFSNSELPKDKDGKKVNWEIQSGNATINSNVITKNENALEYEPIVLKLTINNKVYVYDKILLLDPRVAYVMSYFGGSGENFENPKLAYTYDGKLWYLLNDDQPIFTASSGSKKVRDPYIVRKKDGSFAMIATQGWDNPSIYVWDSIDGVEYTNERLLQLNRSSDTLKMSEKQAWAPEAFYDRRIDQYVIYWSSVEDGGMFYNYSADLNDFTYPQRLLDTGYQVIDGTIVKEGFTYTIILKDERQPMEEYSQLFLGYSDTDYLGFNRFSEERISGHQSEGPFYMKRDADYILYYDDYTRMQFQAMTTNNLRSGEFEQVTMLTDIIAPMEQPRHASVIPVTWEELVRLKTAYEKEVVE